MRYKYWVLQAAIFAYISMHIYPLFSDDLSAISAIERQKVYVAALLFIGLVAFWFWQLAVAPLWTLRKLESGNSLNLKEKKINKYFNKNAYLIFLTLQIILTISYAHKGTFILILHPIILIINPIIYTLIYTFLSSLGEKRIGKNGYTKLMYLSGNGEIHEIKNQFSSSSVDINAQEKGGYTALMYASSGGHLKVVELLLSIGADKELLTKKGNNALFFAKKKSFDEIVSILKSEFNFKNEQPQPTQKLIK